MCKKQQIVIKTDKEIRLQINSTYPKAMPFLMQPVDVIFHSFFFYEFTVTHLCAFFCESSNSPIWQTLSRSRGTDRETAFPPCERGCDSQVCT